MRNFEIYRDKRREWRWRVRAVNGRILAVSSEGYKNMLDCKEGARLTGVTIQVSLGFTVPTDQGTKKGRRRKPPAK